MCDVERFFYPLLFNHEWAVVKASHVKFTWEVLTTAQKNKYGLLAAVT